MPLGSAQVLQRSDRGIEHSDDLAMRPDRVVVPVLNRAASLPFEGQAGVFNGKREFPAGAHDGPEGAVAPRQDRACRHRYISPSTSE